MSFSSTVLFLFQDTTVHSDPYKLLSVFYRYFRYVSRGTHFPPLIKMRITTIYFLCRTVQKLKFSYDSPLQTVGCWRFSCQARDTWEGKLGGTPQITQTHSPQATNTFGYKCCPQRGRDSPGTEVRRQKWILPKINFFFTYLFWYLAASYTASKSLECKIRAED